MKILSIACLLLLFIQAMAQPPKVFVMDAQRLFDIKTKEKEKSSQSLIDSLRKKADDLLDMKLLSVIDKTFTPISGNKHDYMSQAPYFWYDSSKPNGLPYTRRDGEHNPEINKITDHKFLGDLDNACRILSLAWYFTSEEKYAAKAADLLQHWFFDEATKMNPNLTYAQAIPGITDGRGIGIIETRALTGIADAAGLLDGSRSWTPADTRSLQAWYSQYLNWLLTSKNGKEEHVAKNNHGTWFYVQAVDFALFTGDKIKAKKLIEECKNRMDSQINKEGKMQLELERTNALGYSTFNLRAWFDLAGLAEKAGTDLWHYKNKQDAGIRTAFDWLMPYAMREKKWDYQQISPYNQNEFYPLLLQAAWKFNEPNYLTLAKQLNKGKTNPMTELLYQN